MKRIICTLIICLFTVLNASATEASKYAGKNCSEANGNVPVKITVKKEHTEACYQKIGDIYVPSITYGYGDMKIKHKKKMRISYICLRDSENNIFWSCIIPR